MATTGFVDGLAQSAGPEAVLEPQPGKGPPFFGRSLTAVARMSPRIRTALGAATAFACHSLSSAAFVSGLDPRRFYEDYFAWRGAYRFLAPGLVAAIDARQRQTTTSLFALDTRSAQFVDGFGTFVVHDGYEPPAALTEQPAPRAAGALSVANARDRVEPASEAMARAISGSTRSAEGCAVAGTKALLVAHRGSVVAEWYSPGYGPQTPIIGYSVTKSLANAIVGRMVELGRIAVDEADICEEWRSANDSRRAITVDHLLRMESGLRIPETHSGFDPVSRMLFLSADMGAFAARAVPGPPPGRKFRYTSANTALLCRMIRDRLGGSAGDVWRFLDRELFAPLGMDTMLVEYDLAGTPVLSTYAYASARDWARFGMLYLHDGCVGGRRLLPEGWVDYSTRTTVEASYGAGFRVNRPGSRDRKWHRPDLPADTFLAHGHLGQFVIVIPSRDMVVVRLGTGRPDMRQPVADMLCNILDAADR